MGMGTSVTEDALINTQVPTKVKHFSRMGALCQEPWNSDRDQALEESKRFLDTYYMTNNTRETLERWVALGSPDEVVRRLREFAGAGVDTLTIRFPSWDQRGQLRAFLREVAPQL